MPIKKQTLILKLLNTNSSDVNEQSLLIQPLTVVDFTIKIEPQFGVYLHYKLEKNSRPITEFFSYNYFGSSKLILCSISLNGEILYESYKYKDCREDYYLQTLKNKKYICQNGVELDLSGQDCNYYDDGTAWEELVGLNTNFKTYTNSKTTKDDTNNKNINGKEKTINKKNKPLDDLNNDNLTAVYP